MKAIQRILADLYFLKDGKLMAGHVYGKDFIESLPVPGYALDLIR